ncbi:family 43 glycosylhydrolase [Paenibacillus sp. IB182493]|uniref:Family 43 glycosylhydrolase n=2 Tax=Paenibacillus arenilitoris TaxID=2772299 RepID=A0A927CH80_9BACL|nr:family 43 glycosylhydrolase [Paenibacillus arenilitoris]
MMGGWALYQWNDEKQGQPAAAYNGHGGTFKNTLAEIDTPDPSIVYKDGFYYMTFTHHGADVMVMKSRTLDFRQAERKVVWYPPVGTMYSASLWAPEIQYVQGKWYIYFAADDGVNENHRMYALEAATDDPMGEYVFKGQVTDETNKWAIDGLVLEHEEKLYFVWSGWEGDVNVQQNTYIAPMSNPYTISGPRVLLNEPDLDWERAGGPPYINEGQAILKKDGRVFLAYSGAGSWTPFYSIGLLALEAGADPLDASKWRKTEQPLMRMDAEAGVYGPGHNTFVSSPDGTEDWIVYHATSGEFDGWNNRKARAQRIEWDENGMPAFGSPLSVSAAIEVPSGSGVFKAEHAVRSDGEVRFVGLPSAVDTTISVLLHYNNDGDAAVNGELRVGDAEASAISLPPMKDGETGYVYVRVPLQAGQNTISLSGDGAQRVSAIELVRYEAEYAHIGGDSEMQENPFASGGRTAAIGQGPEEALRFDHIQVPRGGDYAVHLAVANASGQEAELSLTVNGGSVKKVKIPAGERSSFAETTVAVKLKAGANSIAIGQAEARFDIDYLDIGAESK